MAKMTQHDGKSPLIHALFFVYEKTVEKMIPYENPAAPLQKNLRTLTQEKCLVATISLGQLVPSPVAKGLKPCEIGRFPSPISNSKLVFFASALISKDMGEHTTGSQIKVFTPKMKFRYGCSRPTPKTKTSKPGTSAGLVVFMCVFSPRVISPMTDERGQPTKSSEVGN